MSETTDSMSNQTEDKLDTELHIDQDVTDEASQIELQIAKLEAKIKLRKQTIRNELYGLIGTFAAGTICSIIFMSNMTKELLALSSTQYPNPYEGYLFLFVSMLLLIVVATITSLTLIIAIIIEQWIIVNIKTEIDLLQVKKKIAKQFTMSSEKNPEQTSPSYFDSLVRINVENLGEYYTLVKAHTEKSFMVSIIVGVVGFILITTGLVTGFINIAHIQTASYIASGSGVITEFIAGVFFYLYNRTVRQMKEYHDSLLIVQNILLSFKIVGDTHDENEKAKMIGQMLAYLIGKQSLLISTNDKQA